MDIYILYQLEAHAVETNAGGELIGGWPIGTKFRYPQTKTLDERIAMVDEFNEDFGDIPVLIDSMSNDFSSTFKTWPDSAMALCDKKVVHICEVHEGGTRSNWTRELARALGL